MEVEREEVCASDEDMAVAEADCECGDVGPVFEEAEGHDWVHGQFPFVQGKEAEGDQTENY